MKKESFKQGITDGIPIALGYLAVSFTFGMMAVQGGLYGISYIITNSADCLSGRRS